MQSGDRSRREMALLSNISAAPYFKLIRLIKQETSTELNGSSSVYLKGAIPLYLFAAALLNC